MGGKLKPEAHTKGAVRILQPLSRHKTIVAKNANEAHDLCATGFPGLYKFSFMNPDKELLSSAMIALDDIYVSTVHSSGHNIWLADDDRIAVLFPMSGFIEVARKNEVRSAGTAEALVVGTGERRTRLSVGYLGALLKLPKQHVHARIQQLQQDRVNITLEGTGSPAPGEIAASIHAYAQFLIQELDSSDTLITSTWATASARNLLLDLVAEHWLASTARASALEVEAGPLKLKRAEAYIRAHAHLPISMGDVAEAAGASLRALQIAFRKHRDCTPYEFLTECRLHDARDRLVRATGADTVGALLAKAGAFHLGRFAQLYRRRFGEPPSATFARSQMKRR